MKLIYCPKCHDVVSLLKKRRTCWCGVSGGQYVDNLNATIDGEAIALGFHNISFGAAVAQQPLEGWGKEFSAFVIPKICPTVSRVDRATMKPGPADYEKMLDNQGFNPNQRNLLYAICREPTHHLYNQEYLKRHRLRMGSIAAALKKLQRTGLIYKADDYGWRIKDEEISSWLFDRLSSEPTDKNDAAWVMYYKQAIAGVLRFATQSFGDECKAEVWLNSPCHALNDQIPAELLARPGGAEELYQYLAWSRVV